MQLACSLQEILNLTHKWIQYIFDCCNILISKSPARPLSGVCNGDYSWWAEWCPFLVFAHLVFHVSFALFCLQCLAHAESYTALVQRLIGSNGHTDLIPNTQQQQPSFSTVNGHLSDEFIWNKKSTKKLEVLHMYAKGKKSLCQHTVSKIITERGSRKLSGSQRKRSTPGDGSFLSCQKLERWHLCKIKPSVEESL